MTEQEQARRLELRLSLIAQRQDIDRRELEFCKTAAAFAKTDIYDEDGSVSPIDWIRFNCRMTSTAAADRIAVGQNLVRLGQTAAAMAQGEVGFAHLTVMARTADAVPTAFDETELLRLARENSPGRFHYLCRHYRHAADARAYAAVEVEQVERRSLELSMCEDGMYLLNGILDSAGGAAVRTALEPLARRSGAHDTRNRGRRLADALVELAAGERPRAQLQVTATLETLRDLPGAAAGEMEFSLPISSTTVERLACDCSLTRMLLGSESQVIEVGRSKRTVSGSRRKALEARDGHCRWPGCERPASWCDGHHVVHWIRGGSSDLNNLVLLCGRHHWMVHEGHWQLVRTDHGRMMTVPPTVTFGSLARAPDAIAAA